MSASKSSLNHSFVYQCLKESTTFIYFHYFFFLEIIRAVKKENQETPFRPPVDNLGASDYIVKCIKACWHEEPELRPDIRYVRVRLKEMQVSLILKTKFFFFGLFKEFYIVL